MLTHIRWRARRQSIKELRRNYDETHREYLKLCAQDKQIRQWQPPQYEDVLSGSGISISSAGSQNSGDSVRSRRTNITWGSNGGLGMVVEQGSERR